MWKSPIQDKRGKPLLPTLDLIPSAVDLLVDLDVSIQRSSLSTKNPLAFQLSQLTIRAETYVLPRTFMRKLLATVAGQYDYILIDCPPNLYILKMLSLRAIATS